MRKDIPQSEESKQFIDNSLDYNETVVSAEAIFFNSSYYHKLLTKNNYKNIALRIGRFTFDYAKHYGWTQTGVSEAIINLKNENN